MQGSCNNADITGLSVRAGGISYKTDRKMAICSKKDL